MTNERDPMKIEFIYYAEPLGNGRAIMRVDTVVDGVLVESDTSGSPAPIETVRAHEERRVVTV